MNEDHDSFQINPHDDSFHVAPIHVNSTAKSNHKIFATYNHHHKLSPSNKCLKVLTSNKMNGKLTVCEQFQDYLVEDQSNPDAVVVSFLGGKKIGKSFLVDSILSCESGRVCRIMTKNAKAVINSSSISGTNRNNEKLIYFDCGGQTTPEIFLWTYFLSSTIIYSISPTDQNEEQTLLDQLSFVQSHFQSDSDDLSLPQLIIVRRDAEKKEIRDRDLIRKVQDYGLFQSQIIIIHLPYPGGRDVKAKELPDVPIRELCDSYTNEIERLLQVIKSGKPKIIRGNYLSSKILSLAVEPITNNLNREHRLCTGKIWDEVIEILSVGFYNFYLKCYSEELQREFESEKPCDKYTVYKKLSKIRRTTNKKVQGFKNISDEPIFEKYKSKLEETLKRKENLVREVNQRKSREANTQHCQHLLKQLNQHNFGHIIDEYCKSELDDQKAEVLLEQFEPIFEARAKMAKPEKSGGQNPSKELQKLEAELAELDEKIKIESQPRNMPSYDFEAAKNSIKTKQQKLQELQAEYNQLKNASKIESRNQSQSQQLIQLEGEIDKLNGDIGQCEREIDELRKRRQNKIKQTTAKLEEDLKKQDENLKKLQAMLRQAKNKKPVAGKADGDSKSTCCSIM